MEQNRKTQFREGLRYLKKRHRLTQNQLAEAAGCSPRHIMSILSKKEKKGAGPEIEQNLCDHLGVSYQYVLDLGRAIISGQNSDQENIEKISNYINEAENQRLIKVPVISWSLIRDMDRVMEGFQSEDAEDWVGLYRDDSGQVFALQIKGDAMSPEFNPDDIIIVDIEMIPETGEFVIVKVMSDNGDEILFKQFMTDGNRIYLKSVNENYPFIEITDKKYQVIGCIIQKIRKYHS